MGMATVSDHSTYTKQWSYSGRSCAEIFAAVLRWLACEPFLSVLGTQQGKKRSPTVCYSELQTARALRTNLFMAATSACHCAHVLQCKHCAAHPHSDMRRPSTNVPSSFSPAVKIGVTAMGCAGLK